MQIIVLLSLFVHLSSQCTTILVGRLASSSNSVLCSQSSDSTDPADPRLLLVPRQNHLLPSYRPIMPDMPAYPRYVGVDRGEDYNMKNCLEDDPLK
jgi:hypothetical protein